MKSKITLLAIAFLISLSTFAQQSINYKAIIKDNMGNVVANQNITVEFTVLKGAAQTNVFQQTRTPTTDANGIIIVNIGGTNDFATIDWGSDEHFLNVQINTGSGLTDMGTTQFRAVPYALNAANVTGLEALDEGNGIGWRLKGQDPDNYGNIGEDAIDLSISGSISTLRGATGNYSLAMGLYTEASGLNSTAMGTYTIASGTNSTAMGYDIEATGFNSFASGIHTIASGDNSTAMGYSTNASGTISTAMGYSTNASGTISTAMGRDTKAEAYNVTTLGRYNIGGGDPTNWVETDALFEIGNGTSDGLRSNALTILKNGTITAPSFDIAAITDDKALITKEYADTNLIGSGLEAIDEGNGIGWRLKGREPANYGNIGEDAIDLSISGSASTTKGATGENSLAMGKSTEASGNYSVALESNSNASGLESAAIGLNASASGTRSISIGTSTHAFGANSTAMGFLTEALGFRATVMGYDTKATSSYSTSFGRFNLGSGNTFDWIETDPLFEVGNGLDDANRNNALTILKNGKVGLGEHQPTGFLEVSSTNSSTEPTVKLVHEGTTGARINFTNTDVTNGNRWTLYGDPNDVDANSFFTIAHPNIGTIFRLQGDGQVGINGTPNTEFHVYHNNDAANSGLKLQNTSSNNEWWRMFTSNTNGNLYLYSTTGGSAPRGNFNKITGVYSSASDKRLKTDFKSLPFSWQNFMNLKTLSYLYKTQKDNKRSLGLIAQEVKLIYPELVSYNAEDDIYHLDYSGFGVVAIKAIQELKSEVNTLKIENSALKQKLNKLEQLETRLSALETASKKETVTLIAKQ